MRYLLLILSLSIFADIKQESEVLFRVNCVACHMDSAHGIPAMQAPAIAGLPRWYISSQLRLFRDGGRGLHPEDPTGKLMTQMTKKLTEREVALLSKHVQNLPPLKKRSENEIKDSSEGKNLYIKNCTECHGTTGEGDRSTKTPPLIFQQDWYLKNQMEKFKFNIRHHPPQDTFSNQEKTDAVIDYIMSLKN